MKRSGDFVPIYAAACLTRAVVRGNRNHARERVVGCRMTGPSISDLHNQFVDHVSRYVRQPEVTSLKAVCQLGMVDAHLMQNGRVQIMDI